MVRKHNSDFNFCLPLSLSPPLFSSLWEGRGLFLTVTELKLVDLQPLWLTEVNILPLLLWVVDEESRPNAQTQVKTLPEL